MKNGIVMLSFAQRAISLICAIKKTLVTERSSLAGGELRGSRAAPAVKETAGYVLSAPVEICFGQLSVLIGSVIESAVELDVMQDASVRADHLMERQYLLIQQALELRGGGKTMAPSAIDTQSRMCADFYFVSQGEFDAASHRLVRARVPATGDVSGADAFHNSGCGSDGLVLAEVTIQIGVIHEKSENVIKQPGGDCRKRLRSSG